MARPKQARSGDALPAWAGARSRSSISGAGVGSAQLPRRRPMYARVVRFTDVTPERIAEINKRVEEEGGPPPDVPAKGLRVIVDEDQSTAIVILHFDSEEDMRKGDEVLSAM